MVFKVTLIRPNDLRLFLNEVPRAVSGDSLQIQRWAQEQADNWQANGAVIERDGACISVGKGENGKWVWSQNAQGS